MFKDLFKEIKKLEEIPFSIPVEMDKKGYLDRQCPSKECLYIFKVLYEDWVNKCKGKMVSCPMCGNSKNSDHWCTIEQIKHAKNEALKYVQHKIGSAFETEAKRFNLSQRTNKSFITVSMKVEKTFKPITIPIRCTSLFEKEVKCNNCSIRFAVVGSAFFCPGCGVNNIEETFIDSMDSIENLLKKIDKNFFIKEGLSKDQSINIFRHVVESSVCNIVASFQSYTEKLFKKYSPSSPLRRNMFQNLNEGSSVF